MTSLRQCLAGLGLDGGLVDRRRALHVGGEVGAGGHEVIFYLLPFGRGGRRADAGSIDALLLHQVVLGVHRTLGSEVVHLGLLVAGGILLLLLHCGLLLGVRGANYDRLGVGLTLQVQSHFVQAGLGFVVYARRTLLVGLEVDRAQRLGVRLRRRRRGQDVQAAGRRGVVALVVRHVAGDRYRSGRSAC